MVEEGDDWKDVNIPEETSVAAGAGADVPPAAAAVVETKTVSGSGPARANLIGPAVKLLLATHGLDPSQVFSEYSI